MIASRCRLLFAVVVAVWFSQSTARAEQGWQLTWSDEFNGAANAVPDTSKWTYDLGGGGWGNNELEVYTNKAENAAQDGKGMLAITALKSGSSYTSARLKTQGKISFTYGKVEARIKVPYGQGIWPAFWMLGADIGTVGWPKSGEIDIMEYIGAKDPPTTYGTAHGPGYSGGSGIGNHKAVTGKLSDDFHVFSVEWSPEAVDWFIDGTKYHSITPASLPSGTEWVFNKPFFILLNLAVGGNWPGFPNDTTVFPAQMLVDYVRVYKLANAPAIHAGGVVNGASFDRTIAAGALVSMFGVGLAGETRDGLFDTAAGSFPTRAAGVEVKVNGISAPLTYVSPAQINFQVPWETPPGQTVDVSVTRDGAVSGSEAITVSPRAPASFAANGAAILNCIGGRVTAGAVCVLWGNGFGAKTAMSRNGTPAPAAALTTSNCSLTVGGQAAIVQYCGAAPSLIIDQLNFVYPSGASVEDGRVPARLTIGDTTGSFYLPAPTGA